MWNGNASYPNRIAHYYSGAVSGLKLVDMACSGETTTSMLDGHSPGRTVGATCPPRTAQYSRAISFLRAHKGSVVLITIDLGGNDVLECAHVPDAAHCFVTQLTVMQHNLAAILSGLRQAAGPNARIVGMTVYDPLLGDLLGPPGPQRTLAESAVAGLGTLNHDLEQVFAHASVPVADVADTFGATDLTHTVSSPWGQIPIGVDKACTLLDITCRVGATEGFGDDPNDAGDTVIAQAFEQKIGTLRS